MSELNIQCICGRTFKPPSKMIEHRQEDGLIELYYLCPHCKTKHHVCYTNFEIKNIQKLIDKARKQGKAETCRMLCNKKKILMDELNRR